MSNRKSPLYRPIPSYQQPRSVATISSDPTTRKKLFGWACVGSFAFSIVLMIASGGNPAAIIKSMHAGLSLIFVFSFIGWIWYGYQTRDIEDPANLRECLVCGRVSEMPTVLRTSRGQVIAILLLLFWILPGLIYIVYQLGRHRCNICGFVGRNFPHTPANQ